MLRDVEGSFGWQVTHKSRQLLDRLAPRGSRRRESILLVLSWWRPYVQEGVRTTLKTRFSDQRESLHLALARSRAGTMEIGAPLRTLWVSGSFGAMERYRCANAREQLALAGLSSTLRRGDDVGVRRQAGRHDPRVLHRLPCTMGVERNVHAPPARGGPRLLAISTPDTPQEARQP